VFRLTLLFVSVAGFIALRHWWSFLSSGTPWVQFATTPGALPALFPWLAVGGLRFLSSPPCPRRLGCALRLPRGDGGQVFYRLCNARSRPRSCRLDEFSALSNQEVPHDTVVRRARIGGKDQPEISERLRPVGWRGDAQWGRERPSFLMRNSSVVGLRPKNAVVPAVPRMRQPVWSRAARGCGRPQRPGKGGGESRAPPPVIPKVTSRRGACLCR
jgi:hypothetical protein